ncbi:type VI secretion system baseplate subunit TssE [Lentibacter algarum]|uniref:type VI secretion system baseplate subunit TssE n=1 Tax=Lentibacter algarum TaxID=576131 RepID=UPI001C06CD2C|nr:type VI secretion system baseplate subunit TssE [Lentibacter algarum]MBU2980565.1 type VI secretion system baseplate subunit TssE [Lentibacter algarum]
MDRDDTNSVARQEAVQPSLWDRLVDELPGMSAEHDALVRDLTKALGDVEQVSAVIAGGTREVERRDDLDDDTKQLAHRLVQLSGRKRRLEEGGVVVTSDVLREAVRRDIEMLFNIERLEAQFLLTERETLDHQSPASQLAEFPQVRASVLNYGVPSFSGRSGSDFDKDDLARDIKNVLNIFEPRLKKDSVKVRVRTGDKIGMRIDIDGVLLLSPVPERLRLSTSVDLDNGRALTTLEVR